MKRSHRKLSVSRQTLRPIDAAAASKVAGGMTLSCAVTNGCGGDIHTDWPECVVMNSARNC